jgi:hypothetical protein
MLMRWAIPRRWLQFRLRTVLIGTAVIAIGLQAWLVLWGRPPFPSADEVESIRVAEFADVGGDKFHDGYLVPKSHWPRLLAAASDCREASDFPDELPDSRVVLTINRRDGGDHWMMADIDHRTGEMVALICSDYGGHRITAGYLGHNAQELLGVLREAQATGTPSPTFRFDCPDVTDEELDFEFPSAEKWMELTRESQRRKADSTASANGDEIE